MMSLDLERAEALLARIRDIAVDAVVTEGGVLRFDRP
jgi:hypothetical protein